MSQPAATLDRVVAVADQQDTFAAIAHVESLGEPLDVAKEYAQLVQGLYNQKKNVPLMLHIGRAGVQYCLSEARRLDDPKSETAQQLRGYAKMMAFNLSVNCWPAWEDEGIVLARAEIAAGQDLARLNLRLAKELQRPADKIASAWWLLGAHQLAASEPQPAIESFAQAAALSGEAEQPEGVWMAKGYAAIAKRTLDASRDEGGKEFQAAIAELRKLDTDDSRFYAEQLEAVDKFFTK